MNLSNLSHLVLKNKNFLCVGLDTDINRLPKGIKGSKSGIIKFHQAIIDATKNNCVAYKINTAFFEQLGAMGWNIMQETLEIIPNDKFVIADAKRGDIGNTSAMYAKTFFETLQFDALTVNPFMGFDSVQPFYAYKDKTIIILGLTSNEGSKDFQKLELKRGKNLFEEIIGTSQEWGNTNNTMYVVGATRAEDLQSIRDIIPNHWLLVPGIGAQGGNLADVYRYGKNKDIGLLVNSSRGIIYASPDKNFAEKAHEKAEELALEMKSLIDS